MVDLRSFWHRIVPARRTGVPELSLESSLQLLSATTGNGEPDIQRRLAAIGNLKCIANESKSDHWPVMRRLMQYVRDSVRRVAEGHETSHATPTRPRPDIQAALTAIGCRNTRFQDKTQRIDLSYTDLRGAELSAETQFAGDFGVVPDLRSKKSRFNMSGADMRGSNLHLATLIHAGFQGADFTDAILVQAIMFNVLLQNATLVRTRAAGAVMHQADIRSADLHEADLNRAVLMDADLSNSNLSAADLSHSILMGATLTGCDLSGAHLEESDVRSVDFSETRGLTQQQVNSAKGDFITKLPTGLWAPDHWGRASRSTRL